MKGIRCILFLLLLGIITEVEADSIPYHMEWNLAQEKMDLGDYSGAIKELDKIFQLESVRAKEINSTVIDELHTRYSINELLITDEEQQVKLTRTLFFCLVGIAILALTCWFYLRWEGKRVKKYNHRLKQAIDEEKKAIYNTNLYLANMSHEIKTPLNALGGFSDILTMDEIDVEIQNQCNEMIQQNSELLLKLINDVADLSSPDITKMKIKLQPCNVLLLCQRVVKTLTQIKTTPVPITIESSLTELGCYTDSTRMQQVLINLLMNATKFTQSGSIVLSIERLNEHWIQFSVTDTGSGIPASDRERIFQKYEKLNEGVQGTGLGLSICKLIVTHLGGKIWLDSTYTSGARFIFTHPL